METLGVNLKYCKTVNEHTVRYSIVNSSLRYVKVGHVAAVTSACITNRIVIVNFLVCVQDIKITQ